MVLSEEPRKYKMIHFLKRSLLKQSLASLQYYFSGQYLIVATQYGPVTEKEVQNCLHYPTAATHYQSTILYRKVTGPRGQRVAHHTPSHWLLRKES